MFSFAGRMFLPCRGLLVAVIVVMLATASAAAVDVKGNAMSYREARDFLAKHTQVLELTNDQGARVAVCPAWQGRVMTSTCDGLDGPSFGFVNRQFIEAGKPDAHFNNYGGEERFWLSPEGGPFSLWFKPGAAQTLDNWYTPPAFNEGAWKAAHDGPDLRMTVNMKLQNASAANFNFDVTRTVRLLGAADLAEFLGTEGAKAAGQAGVKIVGYETANQITNRGSALSEEKGLVSVWILSMLNSGPETVIMVPFRPGKESELGPAVNSDYFGSVPPERLKVVGQAALFRADGHYRSKIGTSQRRARNVMGSIDFQAGVLTLLGFNMPTDPTRDRYLNNAWKVPQPAPYTGDVANSYNDGPNASGQQLGAFYELESLSPAAALRAGESLVHRQRLIHIQADQPTLAALAKKILGVELAAVRAEMLRQ